ncbi:MAG TPA: hypothetical protein VKP11_01345, partial [Frankiaceae bacterium]|nr:hypothetical protein [Frankiaceae bacterium]
RVYTQVHARHVRLVFAETSDPVRTELDRYGITALIGADAYYPALADVLRTVQQPAPPPPAVTRPPREHGDAAAHPGAGPGRRP